MMLEDGETAPGMNKRVKKRWIEALRSGEYKQTTGQLREVEYKVKDGEETEEIKKVGYCCLGVLCDLFATSKAGKNIKASWDGEKFMGATGYLPDEVREWAGLIGEHEGDYYRATKDSNLESAQEALTSLNDTYSAGFKRIANWIEKNL